MGTAKEVADQDRAFRPSRLFHFTTRQLLALLTAVGLLLAAAVPQLREGYTGWGTRAANAELIEACRNDDLVSAADALSAGAEVREWHCHASALKHAINNGNAEIVRLLIKAGVKPNAVLTDIPSNSAADGKTPLTLAIHGMTVK